MVDRVAVARCDVETTTDSVHFHITIDLAALCEGVFELVRRLVVLTLLDLSHVWHGPLFKSIGLSYLLTSITTPVQ